MTCLPACLLLAATLLCACGSAPRARTPAAAALLDLADFIDRAHPNPYVYVGESKFRDLVRHESSRLERLSSPDELAIGLSFQRVIASLGDSHLALALAMYQPTSTTQLSLLPVLPIRVGASILVDAASTDLPRGSVLLSVDGVAAGQILETLGALVAADARGRSAIARLLELRFAQYYHLGFGMRPRYKVRVRLPSGEERELTLAGLSRDAATQLSRERHSRARWGTQPTLKEPAWPTLERVTPGTVLLRLASFGVPDQDAYRKRIDDLFAELNGSDTLILDLRGNEGGFRTHGIAVLNHLLSAPYAQWTRMRTRLRAIPDDERARVSFPFVPEDALTTAFDGVPEGPDGFVKEGDPLAPLMRPTGSAYPGKVVVFADGLTNSAAVEMISALLAFRQGVQLMGEETGGECGRHIGEMPVAYATPGQPTTVLLSLFELTHVRVRGCEPGRGYTPDKPVPYDEAAFMSDEDPYLASLLAPL